MWPARRLDPIGFDGLLRAMARGAVNDLTRLSVNDTLVDKESFEGLLQLVWDEKIPRRGEYLYINIGKQLDKPRLKRFILSCVEKFDLLAQDGVFSQLHVESAWFQKTIFEFRDEFRTLRRKGNDTSDNELYNLVLGRS